MFSLQSTPLGKNRFYLLLIILILCCILLFFTLDFSSAQSAQTEPIFSSRLTKPSYPPVEWFGLPDGGLNDSVWALTVLGDDLFIGGEFIQTSNIKLTKLGHIIRYNTVTNTWDLLPREGLDGSVYALAVMGSDLYVGGNFKATGDGSMTNLGFIARFNTVSGKWEALSNNGLKGRVYALAVAGTDLYVGGGFSETGDGEVKELGNIARYDSLANSWHPLKYKGLDGEINALKINGDDLYAAGWFGATGDGTWTKLGYIVRYDTKSKIWDPLSNQGLNDIVRTLEISGENLFVGGNFSSTGDLSLNNLGGIGRYNITDKTWHPLPNKGTEFDVHALERSGSDLYVGGNFSKTGDSSLSELGKIARYDIAANAWNAMPNKGLDKDVWALAASGDKLFVGGRFDQTGDSILGELGNIAAVTLKYPKFAGYLPLVIKR